MFADQMCNVFLFTGLRKELSCCFMLQNFGIQAFEYVLQGLSGHSFTVFNFYYLSFDMSEVIA